MSSHESSNTSSQNSTSSSTTPRSLSAPRKNVEPFPTAIWEAMTPRQVELGNTFLRMLPLQDALREKPFTIIEQVLHELTGLHHDIYVHTMRVHRGPATLPDMGHSFKTRFQLPPDPEFGVLSCDLGLAESWLRGMLKEEVPPMARLLPLSEQDFGALTYMALRILSRLSQAHGLAPVTLASSPSSDEMLRGYLETGVDVAELVFVISSDVTVGTVRIWMPAHLIQSLENFARGDYARTRSRQRAFALGWGTLDTALYPCIGRVSLSRLERAGLEVGDLLLLDHGLDDSALLGEPMGGRAYIQPSCLHAYLPIRFVINASRGGWSMTIDRVALSYAESPIMTQEQSPAPDVQTQGLVDEARTPLEVRLGQVTLSFEQLAQLQPGHVLNLDQPLQTPVELVAQGQVIGTAELVNIEGRLGARILSIKSR